MYIKTYEEKVVTRFVEIDGISFDLGELLESLEEIKDTTVNDKYGENSLREYELTNPEAMKQLVEMGLVRQYIGPRMAKLYCIKDEKRVDDLINVLYELCNREFDDNEDSFEFEANI